MRWSRREVAIACRRGGSAPVAALAKRAPIVRPSGHHPPRDSAFARRRARTTYFIDPDVWLSIRRSAR